MVSVVLIHCPDYTEPRVKRAIQRGLDLLGGPRSFAKSGELILLKPNLVTADSPDKCVTTHPSVFKAVAEEFLKAGIRVTYGDSPAIGNVKSAVRKAGLAEAADQLGLELADFKSGENVFYEDGMQNRQFFIARGVLEADGIVSLPKLKTHGLERLTGCIKNQFGCVPGVLKGEFHARLPDASDFARMLVDLNRCIAPRLYIMDGIQAMEGNGPRSGTPRQMNLLLFSRDPVALDATVCRLIDLPPEFVPTVFYGHQFGAGTCLKEEIKLLGDSVDQFEINDFRVEKSPVTPFKETRLYRILHRHLVAKPVIEPDRCIRCGMCVKMCPSDPRALHWPDTEHEATPEYQYDDCIRCYCCQEICPESAVVLKVPWLRRLLDPVARRTARVSFGRSE